MKNKSKQDLLNIIKESKDEKEKRKAKMYLYHLMEQLPYEKLQQCILQSSDDFEKKIAEWHLWRRSLDKSFDNLLRIIRESGDEDKVREAAIILGEEGYTEAVDILIDLLRTSDSPYIRDGAALGLRELKDPRAFIPLIDQIKKYPEDCETFVYALEVFDCTSEVELLVDLFVSQPQAILLRLNIIECFKTGPVKKINSELVRLCCQKIEQAMLKSDSPSNTGQLEDLCAVIQSYE